MKKSITLTVLMMVFLSIGINHTFGTGNQTTPAKKTSVQVKKTQPKVSLAEIAEGKRLLSASDCMACHKTDEEFAGPSYKDIAKKYSSTEVNFKQLSEKVINGGIGVWGEVAMPPHTSLSETDAKKMINYILSLK